MNQRVAFGRIADVLAQCCGNPTADFGHGLGGDVGWVAVRRMWPDSFDSQPHVFCVVDRQPPIADVVGGRISVILAAWATRVVGIRHSLDVSPSGWYNARHCRGWRGDRTVWRESGGGEVV